MSWTTPRDWTGITNDIVTSSMLNERPVDSNAHRSGGAGWRVDVWADINGISDIDVC